MTVFLRFQAFSDFLCIFGRKARGKTIFTKYVARHLSRYIILDTRWNLGDLGYVIHYAERLADAFQQFPHVVYQPMSYEKEEICRFFGECLRFQNYTFIIDEVDKFARPRWYFCRELEEIVNRGRHQGIGLIVNSRRPASTHMDLRSNADYVVTFHLHETRDVDYVSEWIGVDEIEPNPIKELFGHESILWIANTGEWIMQGACPP